MKKITFGLIVGTRGFFNPFLASEGREKVMARLSELGYSCVVLGKNDTPYGCVETREHAEKCAELFIKNAGAIDGIIITLPNFGDEIGACDAVQLSGLNLPILVHAFDDEIDRMDVAHRRDAFCGKLSVCNNLHQRNVPFSNTTYHTTSVDSDVFARDIEKFAGVCRVCKGIKGARIAQIGTRPGAFKTVRFSEKLLERADITVVPVDLLEILAKANSIEDKDLIDSTISEIKSYANTDCGGYACETDKGTEKCARLTIAVEAFMRENKCVAGAFQCWDSIQKN